MVSYKTKMHKPRRGLCSTWLAALHPDEGPQLWFSDQITLIHLYSPVWLNWSSGDVYVPLWVKKGTLRFPQDVHTPVVLVGPGTGVAPFRSALQERTAEGKNRKFFTLFSLPLGLLQHLLPLVCPDNVLFFGCRSESKDFYFRSEWEEMVKEGQLRLFTAFSRDQVRNTEEHQ